MPDLPRLATVKWQLKPVELGDPASAYGAGFIGAWNDPEGREKLQDTVIKSGGMWEAQEVAGAYGLMEQGAGKLCLISEEIFKAFGKDALPGAAQVVGDCFPAGTQVTMSDGTTKPIEEVIVGDTVLSHLGTPRPVISTIRKPFSGELVRIRAKGSPRDVMATPDHRFITVINGESRWCPIDLLSVGDKVSLPRHDAAAPEIVFDLADCPNAIVLGKEGRHIPPSSSDRIRWHHSTKEMSRYVRMDERLAWLVGLYLAEGSCDTGAKHPVRITFNLNKNETLIAETAATYIEEIFGVKAKIYQVPSKPSVLYVRMMCGPAAWLLKQLASGNTYTKRLSRAAFFGQSKSIRLAVLRGWFAGDGSLNSKQRTGLQSRWHHFKATGVSVSNRLIEDMFDLANSCGLVASVTFRRARKASKAASNLHLYGSNAVAVFPHRLSECRVNLSRHRSKVGTAGMVSEIANTERIPFAGDVYCIEVEEDHSFIANGYAVHNCVSHSTKNAILGSLSTAINHGLSGMPITTPEGIKQGVLSTEAIYAFRGYNGDGWSCESALEVAIGKVGAVSRRNHPDANWDLTKYSRENAHKYGSRTPPPDVIKALGEHKVTTVTRCKSYEEARDMIASGFALTSCGGEGFASTRNEDGVSHRSGHWSHALAYLGVDDREETKKKYGCGLILVQNSWGKSWISGPTLIRGTQVHIPEGSFWAKWTDVSSRFMSAVNNVAEWKPRVLKDWGIGDLI